MTLPQQTLDADHPLYPSGLIAAGQTSPLRVIGHPALLNRPALAFFCSQACPDAVAAQTHELMRQLQKADSLLISGFHAPPEKVCLDIWLKGRSAVVHCPARGLAGMRIPDAWADAIAQNRFLILSSFPDSLKRASAKTALRRNRLVGAIAHALFIAYAEPGGKTEALARSLLSQKPLFTLDHPDTQNLRTLGAQPISPQQAAVLTASYRHASP